MARIGILPAAAAALVAGCGDPLSNRLFEEDELFSKALPEEDDLRSEDPASAEGTGEGGAESGTRDVGDPATTPAWAREVALGINGTVYRILGAVDWIRAQDITTRERDRRVWGPFEYEDADAPGSLRLTVERRESDWFTYLLQVTEGLPGDVTEDSEWTTLLDGEFRRGARLLRNGGGSFTWMADALDPWFEDFSGSGTMHAEHSRMDREVGVHVVFEDWVGEAGGPALDAAYHFERHAVGGGVLEYRTEADLVDPEGAGDSELETLVVRARWLRLRSGRADVLVRDGDLGPAVIPGSECWDHELLRTYWFLDLPGAIPDEEEGEEDDCVMGREPPRVLD